MPEKPPAPKTPEQTKTEISRLEKKYTSALQEFDKTFPEADQLDHIQKTLPISEKLRMFISLLRKMERGLHGFRRAFDLLLDASEYSPSVVRQEEILDAMKKQVSELRKLLEEAHATLETGSAEKDLIVLLLRKLTKAEKILLLLERI